MMGADAGAIHHDHVHVVGVRHGFHDPIPMACIAPPVEAVVGRSWRAVLLWQVGPGDACSKDIENPVDDAPVVNPLHSARLVWKNRFDEFPLQIAHV